MEEGVSPSLSRNSFPFIWVSDHGLDFLGSLSVSISVSVSDYGLASMPGAKECVSDFVRDGKKSIPKKGLFCASFYDALTGDTQVTTDGTLNVDNGADDAKDVFIACFGGLSSDQGGPRTDPVRSESCEQGDPKNGST